MVGRSVGSAVARNRVKRRLRAAVLAVPGFYDRDRVVIASPAVATARFAELVRWLSAAISHDE